MDEKHLYNRELSWLSFNDRVLQEAEDPSVPLFEKIKFMAIFSSNLDEFYRVRVANLINLLSLKKKSREKLDFDPAELINEIQQTVFSHQERLGKILRENVLPELENNNIYLINDGQIPEDLRGQIEKFYLDEIQPFIQPVIMLKDKIFLFLKNKAIYLSVALAAKNKKKSAPDSGSKTRYAFIEIPADCLPRFFEFQGENDENYVVFLDDIIRIGLKYIFPGYIVKHAYSIKLTRDAEMYIDDEFSGDLLKKIKKGISRRKTGAPSRFLYDKNMPTTLLQYLKVTFKLDYEELIEGGRYHNFSDFFAFPNFGLTSLLNSPMPPLPCRTLEESTDLFGTLREKDIFLFYPYQSFDYVIDFIRQAANDIDVLSIDITLYRIAPHSKIIEHLIIAAERGKTVRAFIELKARFDEESNIYGARDLENAGVQVYYSFPGLKVHSKICLITRKGESGKTAYAYLATGNFNEKTARIYSDMGILTADKRYTDELKHVFEYLFRSGEEPSFKNLLTAPFNMRQDFCSLIDQEILNKKQGLDAEITVKVNSLQDAKMIKKLYKASQAGVKIKIIVRSICCLVPGIEGLSENIQIISIVDRFLEHARIFIFLNGGQKKYYIGSADWMGRNLNRRIEVIFPIFDQQIQQDIQAVFDMQWKDNVKARVVDSEQSNKYRRTKDSKNHQSQLETYEYIRKRN